MARRRSPVAEAAPRTGVVVPPELAVGACLEVWGEPGGEAEREWGPMGGMIAARGRFVRAKFAFARQEQLDTATSCRLLPGGAPWRVTGPGGTERLADLGLSEADLPHLRAAALARVAASDPAARGRS